MGTGPCGARQRPSCVCRQPRSTKGSGCPSCGSRWRSRFQTHSSTLTRPRPLRVLHGLGGPCRARDPRAQLAGVAEAGAGWWDATGPLWAPTSACPTLSCSLDPQPDSSRCVHGAPGQAEPLSIPSHSGDKWVSPWPCHLPEEPSPQPRALGRMRMPKPRHSPSPSPPELSLLPSQNPSNVAHSWPGTAAACGFAGPGEVWRVCLQPHQSPHFAAAKFP